MTQHEDRLNDVWEEVKHLGVYELIDNFEYGDTAPIVKFPSGELELVDMQLGEEGGPENVWVVFRFEDKLYRINGYYNSWNGTDWNSHVEEVQAKEKVIIIYEKV